MGKTFFSVKYTRRFHTVSTNRAEAVAETPEAGEEAVAEVEAEAEAEAVAGVEVEAVGATTGSLSDLEGGDATWLERARCEGTIRESPSEKKMRKIVALIAFFLSFFFLSLFLSFFLSLFISFFLSFFLSFVLSFFLSLLFLATPAHPHTTNVTVYPALLSPCYRLADRQLQEPLSVRWSVRRSVGP